MVTALSKLQRNRDRFDVTTGDVTSVGSAFLRSSAVAQCDARDRQGDGVAVPLGCFYIVTYVVILAVVVDAVLVVRSTQRAAVPQSMTI